jgi:hypothetical protein
MTTFFQYQFSINQVKRLYLHRKVIVAIFERMVNRNYIMGGGNPRKASPTLSSTIST